MIAKTSVISLFCLFLSLTPFANAAPSSGSSVCVKLLTANFSGNLEAVRQELTEVLRPGLTLSAAPALQVMQILGRDNRLTAPEYIEAIDLVTEFLGQKVYINAEQEIALLKFHLNQIMIIVGTGASPEVSYSAKNALTKLAKFAEFRMWYVRQNVYDPIDLVDNFYIVQYLDISIGAKKTLELLN